MEFSSLFFLRPTTPARSLAQPGGDLSLCTVSLTSLDCFSKSLSGTSSRSRQRDLQIFSKALKTDLAVSGESISMLFRASREAEHTEMSKKMNQE